MDIRNNAHFYRSTSKTDQAQQIMVDPYIDLEALIPTNASNKILLTAYKNLIKHFTLLDQRYQKEWQLEINVIARQLTHLFKQAAKGRSYSGYPALSLLKEIRLLDKRISSYTKEMIEAVV